MFQALANLSDLHDGYCKAFNIAGVPILLIQDHGQQYIIENRCPHMDAPLDNGVVSDGGITCRAHGITFNLANGRAQGPLADTLSCLTQYRVDYDGNKIGVSLP